MEELNRVIEGLEQHARHTGTYPPHPGPGYVGKEGFFLDPREYELVSDTNPASFSSTVTGNLKVGWKRLGPVQVIGGTLYLEMGR